MNTKMRVGALSHRKIFVLSLHRTGTRSVHHLLGEAGLTSIHRPAHDGARNILKEIAHHETDLEFVWSALSSVLNRYQAFSDVPFPVLYEQAHRDFPDAKFLLLTRDPVAWLASIRAHIGNRDFLGFERIQYWKYFPSRPRRLSDIPVNALLEMPHRHALAVRDCIGVGDNLLSLKLESPGVGEKICEFIGFDGKLVLPRIGEREKGGAKYF